MTSKGFAAVAAALVMNLAGAAAAAEEPAPPAKTPPAAKSSGVPPDGWRHEIALYVAATGMSGQAAAGGVEADVDLPFSEILDQLEAAGMVAYRAEKGRGAIFANVLFMGLGGTKDLRAGGTAEADFDETLFEVDGAWRFAKHLEVYGGARLVSLEARLELRPVLGGTLEGDGSKTWVDPLVGLRYATPLGKHWTFVFRADAGGFGIGSDFAWQALAHFDWRISKHWGAAFGYVILDIDYDDGEGSDFFLYDIAAQGPLAAATFSF